ncbi:MAG: hypothetical protein AAFV53_16395 [Myxococcota bacterium]
METTDNPTHTAPWVPRVLATLYLAQVIGIVYFSLFSLGVAGILWTMPT